MKTFLLIVGIIATLFIFSLLGFVCHGLNTASNIVHGSIDNAAKVVKKEMYPETLLRKYEWFKNTLAELDKKVADINIYELKLQSMRNDYKGQKRTDWDRTDKETFSVWEQELAGIKASYNSLAAEYNAQMSKLNWAFCNKGKTPDGGEPLPREFRTYQSQ